MLVVLKLRRYVIQNILNLISLYIILSFFSLLNNTYLTFIVNKDIQFTIAINNLDRSHSSTFSIS